LTIYLRKKLQYTTTHAKKSLKLFPLILFSNGIISHTTAYASDHLTQEVSLKTNFASETPSSKNASLEVVHQESTADDPQSSKAEDPTVAATADEFVILLNDKKTLFRSLFATSQITLSKPLVLMEVGF
jgi:hypothetical protein